MLPQTYSFSQNKTLSCPENTVVINNDFIRRFLLHILPMGFMKIRYFGFLAHKNKSETIALLRKLIDPQATLPEKIKETIIEMMLRLTGTDITCCPKCGKGKMTMIRKLSRYGLNSP